jgi:hypothetical protein
VNPRRRFNDNPELFTVSASNILSGRGGINGSVASCGAEGVVLLKGSGSKKMDNESSKDVGEAKTGSDGGRLSSGESQTVGFRDHLRDGLDSRTNFVLVGTCGVL